MVRPYGGQIEAKGNSMPLSNLKMSRRIRRTPFTDKVEAHGVSGFTVVNHTLLPKAFEHNVEEDYWHLRNDVQIWDVGCQRQVQISGPDAERFVQWITPRDLSQATPGKCLYVPLITENGGMINDPVLLKISNDKFWLSIADSDVLLWVRGLALGAKLNVEINEPDVWPLSVQGPRATQVMVEVFGSRIREIKFFNFNWFDFEDSKQLIARSGYSKQGGFEIYLNGSKYGSRLWETIYEAGLKYNIRPGSPNIIERVEAGLLSYGNEMTIDDNPLECGLSDYCNFSDEIDYIGKKALRSIADKGLTKQMRGIRFVGKPMGACSIPWPITSKKTNKAIGKITSGIYSPRLKVNIGLSMVEKDHWDPGTEVYVHTENEQVLEGHVCNLPFES
jgi:dimethylsulfoniopropionate demethylase